MFDFSHIIITFAQRYYIFKHKNSNFSHVFKKRRRKKRKNDLKGLLQCASYAQKPEKGLC